MIISTQTKIFKHLLLCLSCCVALLSACPSAHAQDNKAEVSGVKGLTLSGFVDAYHVWDFDQPADNQRAGFLYNHNRHNEATINLALLHLAWSSESARANVGVMAGTYAESNYAYELALLRSLYEANVGLRLADGLWLDAGLLPSHIGFESAISTDNLALTRSLQAENSPYYLAGVRLGWQITKRLFFAALVANGWQNMRETLNNRSKGGGTQLQYSPVDGLTLNWSSWVSNEKPDDSPALRVFNDLYVTFHADAWSVAAGVDVGWEYDLNADSSNIWWAAAILGRYWLTEWLAAGGRVEHYSDKDGVILGTNGARYTGGSVGLDVRPVFAPNVWIRVEGRLLISDQDRFNIGPDDARQNLAITSSFAARF